MHSSDDGPRSLVPARELPRSANGLNVRRLVGEAVVARCLGVRCTGAESGVARCVFVDLVGAPHGSPRGVPGTYAS